MLVHMSILCGRNELRVSKCSMLMPKKIMHLNQFKVKGPVDGKKKEENRKLNLQCYRIRKLKKTVC